MSKKLVIIAIGIALGILGGYAYWHFYGCYNGCTITSSWWRTSLFGAFFGYLIFDSIPLKKN